MNIKKLLTIEVALPAFIIALLVVLISLVAFGVYLSVAEIKLKERRTIAIEQIAQKYDGKSNLSVVVEKE